LLLLKVRDMKIIGIKNTHGHPEFNPKVWINFDPTTSILGVRIRFGPEPDSVIEQSDTAEISSVAEDAVEVNLAALRSRFDWCDHQTYFLALNQCKFLPVFALFPETMPSREAAKEYAQRMKRNLIVGINVPFAGATDDELFITVNVNANAADTDITVDEHCTLEWSDAASSGVARTMLFPHIHVIAPPTIEASGSATIQLRIEDVAENLLDCTATVYVEAVTGAVPATRIPVKNGLASVPVSAFGMVAGDEVRIKFGWKYFPGADEARIAVV
jgi:hypothetical protein